jgi:protein-S-isoprenylcysteine O-methyltransferase Ste14
MARDLGALTLVLWAATVVIRIQMLRGRGIAAVHFGNIDKTDFLIPPFALLYFYAVFAGAFGWPFFDNAELFSSRAAHWAGGAACCAGLLLMVASHVSFGSNFRVGIDNERPGALVTWGIFAFTRNPIYVSFGCVLLGEFLIQPQLLLLIYLVAGVITFHRQVLREEAFLAQHYGAEFDAYRQRVRRYL